MCAFSFCVVSFVWELAEIRAFMGETQLQVLRAALADTNYNSCKDWFAKKISIASRTNVCANHIIVYDKLVFMKWLVYKYFSIY